jgi:hypothetical protein
LFLRLVPENGDRVGDSLEQLTLCHATTMA